MRLYSPVCIMLLLYCHSVGSLTLKGDDHQLDCLNDYIYGISCILDLPKHSLLDSASYWLEFAEDEDQYKCELKQGADLFFCEMDILKKRGLAFMDTDLFNITLFSCHHGNTTSVPLMVDYMPVKHIRPVPPYNLTLLWEKDDAQFHWQSGYSQESFLREWLQYELRVTSQNHTFTVHSEKQSVLTEVTYFESDTNYSACVRSQPDQVFYRGVWSHWSPALQWTSPTRHRISTSHNPKPKRFPSLTGSLALLCMLPLFLFCYILLFRWRERVFIPTPAPYFTDWGREFNRPAMPHGMMGDLIQGEKSLQIDSLIETSDPSEQESSAQFEGPWVADSNGGFTHVTGPPKSPSMLSSDSGCWLPDAMAMGRESVSCSEDYCTVSY